MARKLSARAWEVLLVIDERCSDGAAPWGRGWVPGNRLSGTSDYCSRLGRHMNVSGAGDARILESLHARGLIRWVPNLGKYAAQITEDGRLLIEQGIEKGSIPLTLYP